MVFFVYSNICYAAWSVVIDKVLYNPVGADNKTEESSYEIVELKNVSNEEIDLNDWELRAGTYFAFSKIIAPLPPKGVVVIYFGKGEDRNLDFSQGNVAYLYRNKDASQLPDTRGDVSLYNSTTNNANTIVDYVAYGKEFKFENSTNFAHALARGIWNLNDSVPLVAEGCFIELEEKKAGNSSDWKEKCENLKNEDIAVPKIVLGKMTMDEHVYENMYANFEIQKNADEKVTWNFGDGHRSYLAKTRHKFELAGAYAASVKVYRGDENSIQNFEILVEKFPHQKIKIVSIDANPKGSDTENETITISNKTKKKINLKGWSVATGWKKMINHPIREDFKIKAGKEKELTREICAFTLVNSKDKIELRYPDGEVASKVKYKKENGSIAEDEIYQKGKKGWEWVASAASEKFIKSIKFIKQEAKSNSSSVIGKQADLEIQNAKVEIGQDMIVEKKKELVGKNKIELAVAKRIENKKTLFVQKMRNENDAYFFTKQIPQKKHYAIIFGKNMLVWLNAKLNSLLNGF